MAGDLRKSRIPLVSIGLEVLGSAGAHRAASIDKNAWVPLVEDADALLVWGGDVLYLSYWMRQSGLADLLPSLRRESVYVGVSAGSMAVACTFGETYCQPPSGSGSALTSEATVFATPDGEISRIFVKAQGAGLVDFALIPHLDHERFPENSLVNAEKWAARLPVPVYAIDDQTAIMVIDGTVEVYPLMLRGLADSLATFGALPFLAPRRSGGLSSDYLSAVESKPAI